ncbi:PQQ-dependent sugar dehydrogenase [Micromonospora sp. PSH03]|uniref:PQQ-dependent sugar dehydrogenase n=1 Tax=Micromonospora salmantinae TaxID=2911211 RepID=UPI001EE7CDCD|nr:PQQ-dependent sugar dehydrogenase [Micromonospora salmantinae]MCG5457198.1 PQQ-dependent sugar dehydrogenase [Micromonospora salmantinae]
MRLRAVLAVAVLVTGGLGTVTAEAEAQPTPGPVIALGAGGFDFADPEVVATGLDVPWGLDFLPDGSALVAQRDLGTVVRIRPGQPPVQVARIPGVVAGGEAGLLGLAVSPRYWLDRWVYVCFTTASDIRITRFRLSTPQAQQVILSGLTRASVHDGGRIAFGPDGLLYAGIGDAGVASNAQNLASRNGKILRIRPNGGIPADNPFPGSPVYSYGHRNVQGLAWDPRGRLFATEFGQATWDEVNVIVRGGNYGWPIVEGPSSDPRFRAPVVVWPPAQASPSGAAFTNGTLFVAALRGTRLWTVPVRASGQVGTPVAELVGAYGRLRTVVAAPDGSLWVATSNRDANGTPAPADDRILRFTTGERQPPPAGRAGSHAVDAAQP